MITSDDWMLTVAKDRVRKASILDPHLMSTIHSCLELLTRLPKIIIVAGS